MTLTTHVRINWPVPAVALLDVATLAANGDPATVERDEEHPSPIWNMSWVRNRPDQGLDAYIHVRWSEQPDVGDEGAPGPPALVVLTIDTTEAQRGRSITGVQLIALRILPAVRDWLDNHHVLRTAWWWEDERNASYHPATTDVTTLADPSAQRDFWANPASARKLLLSSPLGGTGPATESRCDGSQTTASR